MQLTVKTLKGDKFVVEASDSDTVAQVKAIIETTKSDLPAEAMKLIHSGKVLKDEDTIESCQIKPNDFLVVMITKAKKPAAAAVATPSSTSEPATVAEAPGGVVSAPAATATTTVETNEPVAVPAAPATTSAPPSSATTTADEFPIETVTNLTSMGFPEPEVRACLRASRGNPDLAVEFLMNGIPPAFASASAPTSSASSSSVVAAAPTITTGRPLDALRNHPQINQLRTLVQSNPQMLPSVLTQIAQQQPDLLREINANQAEFLEIMNEPVSNASASSTAMVPPVASSTTAVRSSANPSAPSATNPTDLLRDLNPVQLQALANAMGVSPDQLSAAAQFLSSLPPHEMENFLQMQQGMGMDDDDEMLMGEEGDLNAPAVGGAGGGGRARPQVISLTPDEMAAVQRLTELGFDRNLCVQAFLACDKNEALAANLLMDGGFGFDDFNDASNQENRPDDDMYD